ncbi:unnamed protein product [Eruca vesicaria subsp. sativa]|uniref:MADS-box domain-containing protein n=1 Tax=Eruca vesicaria subsp. sativa TaxID=29727 RepID=A0ABC8L0C5_ERUVS|nr:unnamed protein product [Eruca vesicaria subsp. sativa]
MVKRGGTKRKSDMKKITDKASRATTFSKRRDGLYSKAAQLFLLSHAQIAILATPSSSNSNASFFSFGHSSVDSIVSAYLSGNRLPPVLSDTKAMREDLGICMSRMDLGLGFWWNDEKLVNSKNREEIMEAMKSMEVLMSHLKALKNQTLTTTVEQEHEDKAVEISPDDDLDEWSEMELTRLLQDFDDDVAVPPPVVSSSDKEEEADVSEKTCNSNNFVEEEKVDIDWDTVFVFDEELSDEQLDQLISNTDKEEEEEDQTVCNNFVSLPEVAGRSLEEEAMDIDWDAIPSCFASNVVEALNDDELYDLIYN